MARKKLYNKNIRKLARMGGQSIGLTLPIEMIRALGWRTKQRVVARRVGKKIIIADWEKKSR